MHGRVPSTGVRSQSGPWTAAAARRCEGPACSGARTGRTATAAGSPPAPPGTAGRCAGVAGSRPRTSRARARGSPSGSPRRALVAAWPGSGPPRPSAGRRRSGTAGPAEFRCSHPPLSPDRAECPPSCSLFAIHSRSVDGSSGALEQAPSGYPGPPGVHGHTADDDLRSDRSDCPDHPEPPGRRGSQSTREVRRGGRGPGRKDGASDPARVNVRFGAAASSTERQPQKEARTGTLARLVRDVLCEPLRRNPPFPSGSLRRCRSAGPGLPRDHERLLFGVLRRAPERGQRRALLVRRSRTGSCGSRTARPGGPSACTTASRAAGRASGWSRYRQQRPAAAAAAPLDELDPEQHAPRRHVAGRQHLVLVVPAPAVGLDHACGPRRAGSTASSGAASRRAAGSGRDRRTGAAAARARWSRSVSSSKPTTQVAIDRMPCWRSRRIASRSVVVGRRPCGSAPASPRRCSPCPAGSASSRPSCRDAGCRRRARCRRRASSRPGSDRHVLGDQRLEEGAARPSSRRSGSRRRS